jgi:hypothetical protein
VHYTAADPANRIPSSQVPVPREVHQQFATRASLEAAGQLIRKDFMLVDRQNWPKVEFTRAPAQQPPYYNPMQPGRAYNQPPPNKRARPSVGARQVIPPADAAAHLLEEEENSTQDAFDFVTPREISQTRYKQHHEWMEEIFSSPYAVGKILPIDLGLGLMGELAPLTAGILDAPGGDFPTRERQDTKGRYEVKSYSKLAPEDLKEFEMRVREYTKREEAEMEKMKAAHAKKLAALKRSRTYIKAERRLRDLPPVATTRSVDDPANEDSTDPLNRTVNDLEAKLGVQFGAKQSVVCVDKGGFVEEQQVQTQGRKPSSGTGAGQAPVDSGSNHLTDAIDAENSAASLLDQYGSGSLTGTPGAPSIPQISQPQSRSQSAVPTPSGVVADPKPQPQVTGQPSLETPGGTDDLLDLDVEMSDMANVEDKVAESDWVMVDQTAGAQQSANSNQPTTTAPPVAAESAATSGADAQASTSMFDTADFGSFDNLVDSAGDALADYTNVDNDLGLDLVDDSAFGDAFHGTEMHHGEGADGDNI